MTEASQYQTRRTGDLQTTSKRWSVMKWFPGEAGRWANRPSSRKGLEEKQIACLPRGRVGWNMSQSSVFQGGRAGRWANPPSSRGAWKLSKSPGFQGGGSVWGDGRVGVVQHVGPLLVCQPSRPGLARKSLKGYSARCQKYSTKFAWMFDQIFL